VPSLRSPRPIFAVPLFIGNYNKLQLVDNLLKPESKATLVKILTYHVVSGNLKAADVLAAIKKGNGRAELTTLQGEKLTASLMDGRGMLTDAKGGMSMVTATDLTGSNGVIHVVDTVLMPK
jgi:uncharacterized surface protein with fasciclin (FAS1) repeats